MILLKFISLWLLTASIALSKGQLNVYNWSEYILPEDIRIFEQEYDIKVNYNLYDSDYILESKLMSGKTGYDIVFPSLSPFLSRQIRLDLYQPIDKSRLQNYPNIDPWFLKFLSQRDVNNTYSIPWVWSSVGVGYNRNKLHSIFGESIPSDLKLIFDLNYLSKITCGVAMLDSPSDIIPLILMYHKIDPNDLSDHSLSIIEQTLRNISPYIKYFHTSKYIDDLANGEICLVLGYSTDIFQSMSAVESDYNNLIGYFIPSNGSIINVEVAALLKDAPNVENAYKFLDYILRPEVSAHITNKHRYPNAIIASRNLVDQHILSDLTIFPKYETLSRLYLKNEIPSDHDRKRTRLWMRIIGESS